MRILIAGGTGMIGRALAKSMIIDGHSVVVLTRQEINTGGSSINVTSGNIDYVKWDGYSKNGWADLIDEVDAAVNLAGENLAKWPWTNSLKRRFLESRVNSGNALTEAFRAAKRKPKTLLQISGINYYGYKGDTVDESAQPGNDFLARLTVAWEKATEEVESLGVRRCILRLGLVLSHRDGLFPIMALPVRLFLGGPIGNGKQTVSWIYIDDVVGAIRFLLENNKAMGSYNGVSPESLSNADFYRLLSRSLKRPYWFRTPGLLLRCVLGEMSTLVLEGRNVKPKRLLDANYRFQMSRAKDVFDLLRNA